MKLMRLSLVELLLVAVLAGATVVLASSSSGLARPKSLQEIARAAEERGLYWLSFASDGSGMDKILISETPISRDDLRAMRLSDSKASFWIGRVFVYDAQPTGIIIRDPAPRASWGDLYVYGDAGVIERLSQGS